jgi:hypothetical protein
MARLYLFAEGQTEQTFASNVLKPHLAERGVYMQNPVLIAHARKHGGVHRGGGRKYTPMRNDIRRFLAQEDRRDVFFTSMIDLYAIPADFPGLDEAEKLRHDPTKRVESLEKAFADDVGNPRFLPFIQLHEFEAYLFSDPTWFEYFYPERPRQIATLKAIAEAHASPELIDDGAATAPSKRIEAQFDDYKKVVVGTQVAELIGLVTIRARCPHFAAWLSRLEGLGVELTGPEGLAPVLSGQRRPAHGFEDVVFRGGLTRRVFTMPATSVRERVMPSARSRAATVAPPLSWRAV